MGLPMMYRSAVGLRNELTLNLDVEDGLVNGADHFVICFHNAQSVKLHLEDMVSEQNVSRADVLILTESKLCAKDNIQIPGRTLHRNDFAVERTPYGSIVITKPQHQVHVEGRRFAVLANLAVCQAAGWLTITMFSSYNPMVNRLIRNGVTHGWRGEANKVINNFKQDDAAMNRLACVEFSFCRQPQERL
ncbi:hypothetical protein MAR_027575 [Mya arenaria]|uniref:Uncharacterized protein n=1 Tax=Mya arenaria TaxID=6604 RepID=A0ABY7EU64_MYAAR|nr:hypothetical protein MAR_027575 [Mya arenaria]